MFLSDLAPALLSRCRFPAARAPVDLAVSGGRDSLALLALGVAAGCEVTAYHVDHAIRPNSEREAEVVAAAAERLGARFVALKAPCAPGPNLEARARAGRFGVLPRGIATGHTADDQAETVLLNLLRGAGLDGLSAMRLGPRHPILALRRVEAARLVDSLGLTVVMDPSNADPSFRRNRVRHELLPLLDEISGRDLVPVLCRQSELLGDERDLLEALSEGLEAEDVESLGAAPLPLQRRALRRWLSRGLEPPYPPDLAALERVLAVARGEVRACELPGGRRVRRSRGRLIVSGELAPLSAESSSEPSAPCG